MTIKPVIAVGSLLPTDLTVWVMATGELAKMLKQPFNLGLTQQ